MPGGDRLAWADALECEIEVHRLIIFVARWARPEGVGDEHASTAHKCYVLILGVGGSEVLG